MISTINTSLTLTLFAATEACNWRRKHQTQTHQECSRWRGWYSGHSWDSWCYYHSYWWWWWCCHHHRMVASAVTRDNILSDIINGYKMTLNWLFLVSFFSFPLILHCSLSFLWHSFSVNIYFCHLPLPPQFPGLIFNVAAPHDLMNFLLLLFNLLRTHFLKLIPPQSSSCPVHPDPRPSTPS